MRIPVLLSCLLLTACASWPGYRYPTGPTPVPRVTSVTLNRPFTIRADRASEYLQDGKIMPYRKISEYYPHCIFELRLPADKARTVQPDTFTVTAIRRDRFMAWATGRQFAADSGGDYNMVMSSTVLSLHSDRQPEVFRLTCQELDEPFRVHHVTLVEMQQALGNIITLNR
jgi:hypothetical protein